MTADRIARWAAATAWGLLAMGAAPGAPPLPVPPVEHARAAIAKALASPRLYRVTRSGGQLASANTLEMCVDAEVFDRLTGGPGAPAVGAPVTVDRKGCTLSFKRRADGGFHMDDACDKAAGASHTSHSVVDGTVKDMRSSLEMAIEDPRSGDVRIVSMDMRMVDAGACPAGLAPGQARTADGRVVEPFAARAAKPATAR
ncbi:MAG: hypothetical protein ACXWKN_14830 [Phenylobacterium sp.]